YLSKKLKLWLLIYQDNNIIIEKIKKYLDNKIASISYWKISFNTNHTLFYSSPEIQFKCCSNCYLNSKRIQYTCTIEVPIIFSTQFLDRYSLLSYINLYANLIDLICSIAVKHPLTIPQPPLININNEISI
ncbi:15509_t:CDS:1, partial [Gigaspora margarita]